MYARHAFALFEVKKGAELKMAALKNFKLIVKNKKFFTSRIKICKNAAINK